jgi:hypothetical protein
LSAGDVLQEQIEVDEDEEEAASSSVLLLRGMTRVLGRRIAAQDIFITKSIRRSAGIVHSLQSVRTRMVLK